MNNIDALRISENRDDLCGWAVERFRELLAEGRNDDAICLADEWFEWLDPENYINEQTHYYDEHELQELYESFQCE